MSFDAASFSVEESDFYRLFGALCVRSEKVAKFAQQRQVARWLIMIVLIGLVAGFMALINGANRFPDFSPLMLPLTIIFICGAVHEVVGYRLDRIVPLFKALYHEDDPNYPVLYRIKFKLETDRVFDFLRQEGYTLTWSSALEEYQGAEQLNRWLADTLGHRLT